MKESFVYENSFWKYLCPILEGIDDVLRTIFYSQEVSDAEGTFGTPRLSDYFIKKGLKKPITL